jgi:hypothetical protein
MVAVTRRWRRRCGSTYRSSTSRTHSSANQGTRAAACTASILSGLWAIEGRLYDLCIRHRRTNLHLSNLINATDTQLGAINEKIGQLSYGFGADLRTKHRQDAENADFQRLMDNLRELAATPRGEHGSE